MQPIVCIPYSKHLLFSVAPQLIGRSRAFEGIHTPVGFTPVTYVTVHQGPAQSLEQDPSGYKWNAIA